MPTEPETTLEPNGIDLHLAMDLQAMALVNTQTNDDTPPTLLRLWENSRRICIEGNIGCGKSTVINYLAQHLPCPEWHVMAEPVQFWQPLLAPFYEASSDHPLRPFIAALLQIAVLTAYANEGPDRYHTPKAVMERGPWSCLEVFMKAQDLPDHLQTLVKNISDYLHPSLMHSHPDVLIYLDCPPTTCLERTQQRQREGENDITLNYLTVLDQFYNTAVDEFSGVVIRIDATQDATSVARQVLQTIETLTMITPEENLCMMTAVQESMQSDTSKTVPNHPAPTVINPPDLFHYAPVPLHLVYDASIEFPVLFRMDLATLHTLRPFMQSSCIDMAPNQSQPIDKV